MKRKFCKYDMSYRKPHTKLRIRNTLRNDERNSTDLEAARKFSALFLHWKGNAQISRLKCSVFNHWIGKRDAQVYSNVLQCIKVRHAKLAKSLTKKAYPNFKNILQDCCQDLKILRNIWERESNVFLSRKQFKTSRPSFTGKNSKCPFL